VDRVRRARTRPQSTLELAGSLPPSEIEHHAPCPACEADRVRVRYHPRFGGGRSYWVGQCDECDLLYRVPAIRPERVPDLYSTGTYADFLDGDYGHLRQNLYRYVLDKFSPQLDDGAGRTVLDFGCGTGMFMEVAAERGFEVYGVDLAPDARARAADRWGASRVAAEPSLLGSGGPQQFDLITMWSVLAHIADPADQIGDLGDRLRPGGQLLIYTVNADSLQRRAYGSRWNGFTPNHLIFWDRKNLERLLLKSGFSAVDFRHQYEVARDSQDFSDRLIARHHRAVERFDGANMLGVLATR
jgi:2-polyprenyl-3-methyl-5-hydroxy-6-metoxy-1,4-benzoquinol methylase